MTHLLVDLYDRMGDPLPCYRLDDHDAYDRQYFHDLRHRDAAERVGRVVITPGDEYRIGDHVRLFDRVSRREADTITIDPAIATDVDLEDMSFEAHRFAKRPAALMIITNPNLDSGYRLRISLYDRIDHRLPSLTFYDWEYPSGLSLADLGRFHFANKTAFIRIEKGPDYQPSDKVVLWQTLESGSQTLVLGPGDYDLSQLMLEDYGYGSWSFIAERRSWSNQASGLELDLCPRFVMR